MRKSRAGASKSSRAGGLGQAWIGRVSISITGAMVPLLPITGQPSASQVMGARAVTLPWASLDSSTRIMPLGCGLASHRVQTLGSEMMTAVAINGRVMEASA